MDSLTQAALGAAVGHLCWQKKLGRKAVLFGAVLGTIPDLDIIAYPLLDEVQRLYWHRGESHSVFFMFLGAIPTAWLISSMLKKKEMSFSLAYFGAFLIYSTHILIDFFTIYGTQLLAPVSRMGFASGNLFIIDPLFSLPLLIGLISAFLLKHPWNIRSNILGLTFASCYAMWSLVIQSVADHKFSLATEKTGYEIHRQITSAGAFTTFLWRHVAETPDGFLLGYWSLFDDRAQPLEFTYIPKRAEKVATIQKSRTFTVVEWFSKGWWCVMPDESGSAKIVDMRFSEIPSGKDQSYQQWNWPFAWKFELIPSYEHPLKAVLPEIDDPLKTLNLLAKRITGGRGWISGATEENIGTVLSNPGSTIGQHAGINLNNKLKSDI